MTDSTEYRSASIIRICPSCKKGKLNVSHTMDHTFTERVTLICSKCGKKFKRNEV